ncbi:MdtA/MuxA family multidrug efflux RND transporter periplasmic adaptor subunit [Derxia lacustris]|uniref:MdtA/MuxA family multidrug efflux RND transporter periplasmic adaptor subunit n=1 Tax=Derxia lacustris TaxID=764842 RepID=UPI000A16D597|nr:MdtA/MuxA family multidrug efflux RND transporter periplasmic adaptor subunit [Derxia lacustris]
MNDNNRSDRADAATDPLNTTPTASTTPVKSSSRWLWWLLALLLLGALGVFGWRKWHATEGTPAEGGAEQRAGGPGAAGGPGGPGGPGGGRRGGDPNRPQPVVVETAHAGSLRVIQPAVGNITALATVTVRARVDGTLDQLLFKEGDVVQAGQLLARIDPRAYDVALLQAKGQLARDEAQLANARVDLERYRGLLAQDSIARQQVDTQAALVRQYEATVQVDRAAVASAELNLSYTRITAPVAGRLGLRQVDAGNLIRSSDADGLVVLTQLQPISALFSIPESALPRVRAALRAGKPLVAEAWDRDQRSLLATGTVASFDNLIDSATGTVKLRALFPNADSALFPNQFVNVRLVVDTLADALLVPTAAVLRGSQGTYVYRVGDDNTVSVRPVRIGAAEGELTVIEEGLKPGAVVVIEGSDKLRDGAKVEPVARATAASAGAEAAPRKRRRDGNGDAAKPADGAANAAAKPADAAPAAPRAAQ